MIGDGETTSIFLEWEIVVVGLHSHHQCTGEGVRLAGNMVDHLREEVPMAPVEIGALLVHEEETLVVVPEVVAAIGVLIHLAAVVPGETFTGLPLAVSEVPLLCTVEGPPWTTVMVLPVTAIEALGEIGANCLFARL